MPLRCCVVVYLMNVKSVIFLEKCIRFLENTTSETIKSSAWYLFKTPHKWSHLSIWNENECLSERYFLTRNESFMKSRRLKVQTALFWPILESIRCSSMKITYVKHHISSYLFPYKKKTLPIFLASKKLQIAWLVFNSCKK